MLYGPDNKPIKPEFEPERDLLGHCPAPLYGADGQKLSTGRPIRVGNSASFRVPMRYEVK